MSGMDTLGKLFGSEDKVKLIKLFLFNPEKSYTFSEIKFRSKTSSSKAKKELNILVRIGLIRKRRNKEGSIYRYYLNKDFAYSNALQSFFLNTDQLRPKEIIRRVSKLGSVKLIVISGFFIQDPESRIDMLIVGDGIKMGSLEKAMKQIESEVGKELKYAYFSTDDFKYRLSMFDKLTRDILDYPHKKVLNKLGIV